MSHALKMLKTSFATVWMYRLGRIGLVLLLMVILISLVALAVVPPDISSIWNNPRAWAYLPKTAPPDWVASLGLHYAPHRVYENPRFHVREEGGILYYEYRDSYTLDVDDYPQNIAVLIKDLATEVVSGRDLDASIRLLLLLDRPDGETITLFEGVRSLSEIRNVIAQGEAYGLVTDPATAISSIRDLVVKKVGISRAEFAQRYEPILRAGALYVKYAFSRFSLEDGELVIEPLTGTYRVRFIVCVPKTFAESLGIARKGVIRSLAITVIGNRYGLLGTDYIGRDLALGVLYGFPIALLIGVFAAGVAIFIGAFAGIISGYYGGVVDELTQRVVDVLGNIPLLPILVLIGAIVQQAFESPWLRLLSIIVVYIVFSWGGTAIVTRAMTLSIKAEPFVEAARALGANTPRIIFRHVFPNVLPYVFASLVFAIPGAILLEAGLSILGIYHGLPTWGMILASAEEYRGVAMMAWWWIFPPGIAMALTSFTFVALGMAVETIVDPRLRRGY